MTIENFIPAVWSARLLEHIQTKAVLTQDGVVNRSYEGEIRNVGDRVYIHDVDNIQVFEYQKGQDLASRQALDARRKELVIDKAFAFNFAVDDIVYYQSKPKFMDRAMEKAGSELRLKAEKEVAKLAIYAGPDIEIRGITDPEEAYSAIVEARKALVKNNAPEGNWWLAVSPEFYALLLKSEKFVDASKAGTTEGLRNGVVGKVAGFTVLETNNLLEDENGVHMMAGTPYSIAFAEQITKIEAYRPENTFADAVKGLYVFGCAVLYPEWLVQIRF